MLGALSGCGYGPVQHAVSLIPPTVVAPPAPTARAIALRAARVLVPYTDPLHTYQLRRPQTWVVLDAQTDPTFAAALGDGVRFFEPIVATDPDAGNSGKLWIDVLPAHGDPRGVLVQPFVADAYPPALIRRFRLGPTALGGVRGYQLITLAGKTQLTLFLVPRRGRYYRVTVFGAFVPPEVALALDTWRFR